MEIRIQQKAGLTTNEYLITIDEKRPLFGYLAIRGIHQYLDILSPRGAVPQVRIEIKRHKTILYEKFTITLNPNRQLVLRSTSLFRHSYEAFDGDNHYEIFGHRGLSASIFLNGEQIGLLDKKNIVSVLGKDRYTLLANDDAEVEILVSLALIWDNLYGDRTIDLGQLLELRGRDHDWKPKG